MRREGGKPVGEPKDLNQPPVYAEGLVRAAMAKDNDELIAWISGDENPKENPFYKWFDYFASRLRDMAPRPQEGFRPRPKRDVALPKIGRNDQCPCGSGKKFKACHLGEESVVSWKLGSPTPEIRAVAIAQLVSVMPVEALDKVPVGDAPPVALSEMAAAYQAQGQVETALELLKMMLDDDRNDPHILYDYWIARYAEWLVEAGRPKDSENFLLDEFDAKRSVEGWQVAQKLAAFYLDQGDPDNAETWVDASMEGPENPFNHYLKGLMKHYLEDWDAAIASYETTKSLTGPVQEAEESGYLIQLADDGIDKAKKRLRPDDDGEGADAPVDAKE